LLRQFTITSVFVPGLLCIGLLVSSCAAGHESGNTSNGDAAAESSPAAESAAWQSATKTDTIDVFVAFLTKFPSSEQKAAAEAAIQKHVLRAVDQAFILAAQGDFDQARGILHHLIELRIDDPVVLNNHVVLQVHASQEQQVMTDGAATLERAKAASAQRVIAPLVGTVMTEPTRLLGGPPFELQMYLYPRTTVSRQPFDWKAHPEIFMTRDDVLVETLRAELWGDHQQEPGGGFLLMSEIGNNLKKLETLREYKRKDPSQVSRTTAVGKSGSGDLTGLVMRSSH
jgi:hypothetical protein